MSYMIFEFAELPLAIVNGVEAGFVNGEAELEYTADGEWMIIGITLEGGSTVKDNKRFWPQVECPSVIAAIIDERLNKKWHGRVQDTVREQIEQDRIDAEEQRADMRRDERMGL